MSKEREKKGGNDLKLQFFTTNLNFWRVVTAPKEATKSLGILNHF